MTEHKCYDATGEADEVHLTQGKAVPCWCPLGHDHDHLDYWSWT